jgi:AcrR family transcriptional regulator
MTSSAPDKAQDGHYHHGDLKAALLAAAEDLLRERGLEGFTLRECARRAGVSHAAPAHHFGDLSGLFAEFAAVGFARLQQTMQGYRAAAGPDPVAQLHATGQAYIDFAIANPEHFRLMFRRDKLDQHNARLQSAGEAAFGELRSALALAIGESDDADLTEKQLTAWSTVHGFATLLLEGQLAPFCGGDELDNRGGALGDAVLATLFAGLVAEQR